MINNKIFLISFEYFPISNGGLARYGKEIIDRLLTIEGYQAIIAIPTNKSISINKNIITIPCKFYHNKYLCYLEFSWKLFLRYKKELRQFKFILFSTYSFFLNPFLPKYYYIFITNTLKRVLITDYPEEGQIDKLKRKIIYLFTSIWEKYLSVNALKIFCISQSTRDDVMIHYKIKPNKIKIIECGLNNKLFHKSNKIKFPNKNLLFVGRIVSRKNLLNLIKIFTQLIKYDDRFKLHIVGNGDISYLNKLKQCIKNNKIINKVIFHGLVSDEKLKIIYSRCGVFVFTSLVEGFGLVLLEAMSKGLPVIAYDIVGVRDVVINNKNGFLVNVGDTFDFVGKIRLLFQNKNIYQKFSRNSLKRIDDFDWNRSIKKIESELND